MEFQDEKVRVADVIVANRHRLEIGDLSDLMASIEQHGGDLIHPITITKEYELIAGERRLEAVRKLGHPTISARIVTDLSSAVERLLIERDENTARKPMTPEEQVSLGRALEALEAPKAMARKAAGVVASQPYADVGGRLTHDKSTSRTATETRHIAAKAVGMGRTAFKEAKAVVDAAHDPNATPADLEIAQRVLSEMNATRNIHGAFKKVHKSHPKAPSIDRPAEQRRTLDRAVSALSGIALGLNQIETVHPEITCEEAAQWVDGLQKTLRSINVTIKRLKGAYQC